MALLTTEQLAAHLSVSARQIQRLAAAGMPSVPIGARGRRYDAEACVAWLQANEGALSARPPRPQTAASRMSTSAESAYTSAYRKTRLRVMPSGPTHKGG